MKPRHELTQEERRRGALRTNALKRERRAQAEERLGTAVDKALDRLVELLDADDPHVQLRAVSQILDRVLGKPRQPHEHSGIDGDAIRIEIESAREKLSTLLDAKVERTAYTTRTREP